MRFSGRESVATVILLTATLSLSKLSERRVPESLVSPLDEISTQIAGWTAIQEVPINERSLERLKPTSVLSRIYEKNGRHLELFVAFYSQQRAGETMHSPKQCLPGSGWEIWKRDSAELISGGQRVVINKYEVRKSTERMLVFYWYQSRKRVIASEYLGKVLLIKDTLLGGRTAGSIVRVALPDVPGGTEEGIEFASGLLQELQKCYSSSRGQGVTLGG